MFDIRMIAYLAIVDPKETMRSEVEVESLSELAQSIRQNGLINPITVRKQGDKYEVVAGHRRYLACGLVGLMEVPCIVRELDDEQGFDIMAAENLERIDIDAVDEALFVGRLMNREGVTIQSLAKHLNRSSQWVTDRLDILSYPDDIVAALKSSKVSLGVARFLAGIETDNYRSMYLDSAIKNGMSVVQAEYALNQFKLGLMPTVDQLVPPPSDFVGAERVLARASCARCNGEAVEPNLRMVWTHIECPVDPIPESPASVASSL